MKVFEGKVSFIWFGCKVKGKVGFDKVCEGKVGFIRFVKVKWV